MDPQGQFETKSYFATLYLQLESNLILCIRRILGISFIFKYDGAFDFLLQNIRGMNHGARRVDKISHACVPSSASKKSQVVGTYKTIKFYKRTKQLANVSVVKNLQSALFLTVQDWLRRWSGFSLFVLKRFGDVPIDLPR